MTTTSAAKRITYNRTTKDYDATFDGRYIGSFANHHQAEVALNDYALDLIEQGLVDDMQVLARPAEVVELLHSGNSTTSGGGGTCESCMAAKPDSAFTTVLNAPPNGPIICDACLDALPMDLLLATRRLNELSALPAAPPAVETIVRTPDTFSGPDGSTTRGGEDAAPSIVTLRNAIIDYLGCPTCHGEGIHWQDINGEAEPEQCDLRDVLEELIALTPTVSPDPATPTVAPAYCLHLDACAASSCPACTDPAGPYRCPLCQTNAHYATQCPDVALTKYGMGVWEAYMEDRAAFLRLIQWAAAARLLLMGNAVAHYLSARWGHPITGHQVLVAWMQNAARA